MCIPRVDTRAHMHARGGGRSHLTLHTSHFTLDTRAHMHGGGAGDHSLHDPFTDAYTHAYVPSAFACVRTQVSTACTTYYYFTYLLLATYYLLLATGEHSLHDFIRMLEKLNEEYEFMAPAGVHMCTHAHHSAWCTWRCTCTCTPRCMVHMAVHIRMHMCTCYTDIRMYASFDHLRSRFPTFTRLTIL